MFRFEISGWFGMVPGLRECAIYQRVPTVLDEEKIAEWYLGLCRLCHK